MFIDKSLLFLTAILLALDPSETDDPTTTLADTVNDPLETTPTQQDPASATVGKLSDWWNEYVAKVKASSPTPVWIHTSSKRASKTIALWWLDMEIPTTTRRRLKHRFPIDWLHDPLGAEYHRPKFGEGAPQKDEKKDSSCPHCPCQSTTCHAQDTKGKPGEDGGAGGNDKPSDKDRPADKDRPGGGSDSSGGGSDSSGGKDRPGDKDKLDQNSDNVDGVTKPFKKCTCITTARCPCQNIRQCTCPPALGLGRAGGRSGTVQAAKSNASCKAMASAYIVMPLLFRSVIAF